MRLANKVAVVTGGARGIGRGIAERFIAEGCRVMIGDIDGDGADATAQAIGEGCAALATDVSTQAGAQALVDAAVERFGRLDICVNNAAIVRLGLLLDLSEADFDAVMAVNIKGAFLTGQAAARQMVAQGHGGAIINLSSVNAMVAIPNQTAYTVSKGAIHQLTRSMAVQLARYGIRSNAIGPGLIDTELNEDVWRDDASYVTGETVYADGGRLALNLTLDPEERGS